MPEKASKVEPGKPPSTRPAVPAPAPKVSAPSREVAAPAKQTSTATASHNQVLQTKAVPTTPLPTGNGGAASDSVASQALTAALKILAEESGVDQADLTDDVAFADVGVDSLLSLVIGSRFRDELSIDLEPENLFTQCPTVKELKALFSTELDPGSVTVNGEVPAPSAVNASAVNQAYPPEEPDVAQETITHDSTPLSQPVPEHQVDAEPATVSPLESTDSGPGSASFASVLQIIAEESGVAVEDLGDDVVLADIGVDSLLALVIGSRIRDEMSVDLDVETMLVAFPSVKALKSHFDGDQSLDSLHEVNSSRSSLSSTFDKVEMNSDTLTPKSEGSESGILSAADSKLGEVPTATSVVLQGVPKSARRTIFLFPDGCGSATSYADIPRVSPDTAVVGLNSPYLKNPHEMTSSIDDLITSYLNEICRRQPSGPFHFGGWSIGGILAYHAAQRLLNQGERVHSLILIDSPAPNRLGKLPQHFYDYCDSVGLFGQGTGKAPEWLVPHFKAANNLMSEYYAAPLLYGKAPKTTIIWAGESVVDGKGVPEYVPRPGDPEDVKFLTVSRTDFSVGAWGRLFPRSEVNVETAVGANHFSMMVSCPFYLFPMILSSTNWNLLNSKRLKNSTRRNMLAHWLLFSSTP